MMTIQLESRLACPICGHAELMTMPTDPCRWFYECPGCKSLLKPKPGNCCVFCSYGSVPCPPLQAR
ncbi:MAG: GDCCVxC domain-containing (seleno)protein [Gallionella sp.]|nr:GDCCVxC domain-containing (seleno)protein [Gallionella sp.]